MRGARHEVVAFHCECPVTKQMRQDSARLEGKKMAIKIENKNMKVVQIVVL
jgi:hypothetical protein